MEKGLTLIMESSKALQMDLPVSNDTTVRVQTRNWQRAAGGESAQFMLGIFSHTSDTFVGSIILYFTETSPEEIVRKVGT